MAGFRKDIFKSSMSAVLTAILLGACVYLLYSQVERAPRILATMDAYTEKGGYGPNIVTNFYLSTENVTIFANMSDETKAPITNTNVKFEVHGPSNPYQNITLTNNATTNSSGIATITLAIPYDPEQPETVIGIWSVSATSAITEGSVIDSLAFEVKLPPTPFVDVYTDKGGKGARVPSQPYKLGDMVYLYAEVSNGTAPVGNVQVAFSAYRPTGELPYLITVQPTNASGVAETSFRTSYQPTISLGTWQVIVTVKIEDQVYIDALIFECTA